MDQNNDNSKTTVFNPLTEEEERKKLQQNNLKPALESQLLEEQYYEYDDDEEEEEEEEKSSGNGILIALVIILVVLFIGAMIWGAIVINKISKEERETKKNPSSQQTHQVQQDAPDVDVQVEDTEEEIVTDCRIYFKGSTVEEKDGGNTVRAEFIDTNGDSHEERVTIDRETQIREDGYKLSYNSFIDELIALNDREIEFMGSINMETLHVESIVYEREALGLDEEDEEGIVIEEDPSEELFPGEPSEEPSAEEPSEEPASQEDQEE